MPELQLVNPEEISPKDLILKIREWWSYFKTQWLKIAIVGLIGGIIGFIYAWMQPIKYTSKISFVVEEGKSSSSSISGLASIAGQFGVDVGGNTGGGVLSGDNILLYFKSESLAREVLLSRYDSMTNKSVADIYAEVYKMKDSWNKNEKIGNVSFPVIGSKINYTRLQDSLIQQMINSILKTQFMVGKTDKKASFIEVRAVMENEFLAKVYCERIVNEAVSRYLNVKTQRQKITVDKLQKRVDSIANLLSRKTASGAALQTSTSTMDINPLYRTGTVVAAETTVRDKTMLSAIFASVTQNLELAKFALSQETPVIEVVDSSIFPLEKEKKSKPTSALLFSFISCFSMLTILVLKKVYKSIMI